MKGTEKKKNPSPFFYLTPFPSPPPKKRVKCWHKRLELQSIWNVCGRREEEPKKEKKGEKRDKKEKKRKRKRGGNEQKLPKSKHKMNNLSNPAQSPWGRSVHAQSKSFSGQCGGEHTPHK